MKTLLFSLAILSAPSFAVAHDSTNHGPVPEPPVANAAPLVCHHPQLGEMVLTFNADSTISTKIVDPLTFLLMQTDASSKMYIATVFGAPSKPNLQTLLTVPNDRRTIKVAFDAFQPNDLVLFTCDR